jgi:hypothetical protein
MPLARNMMAAGIPAVTAQGINGTFGTVAATGSVQGDAALVQYGFGIVTAADGTKGVILPAGQPGDWIQIVNNSASSLRVYPPSGAAITVPGTSLGSANAAYTHTTFAVCTYRCFSATQWSVQKSA